MTFPDLLPWITLLLIVGLVVVGILVWRVKEQMAMLRQQAAAAQELGGDIGIIKSQLQNLPGVLGDLGAVKSQVQTVAAAMQDLGSIKSQVETLSGATGDIGGIRSQVEAISQTIQQIGSIKSELESVKDIQTALDETIGKIADKLIGSRDVGEAGENLLAEAFACFPPGWIERDFRVGGKVVEFALVLPNQKRLPIDSKFPAVQPLQRLGETTSLERRQEIIAQIEAAVLSKAQEAKKYIDPSRTIYLAIAAIPDAAYSVCRKAHFQAIGSDVLVVSYSIALPVVLALYKFQLQYATSIDQQNLESYLLEIESCLKRIEKNLENRIKDAGSMINNAYNECMTDIGKVRAALSALRTPVLPAPASPESPESRDSKTEQLTL